MCGYTPLIEHPLETGTQLPFRQKAQPVPNANRIIIERELKLLLRLGIIFVANPGACLYASPIVVFAKNDATFRVFGLQGTQSDDNQKCLSTIANRRDLHISAQRLLVGAVGYIDG